MNKFQQRKPVQTVVGKKYAVVSSHEAATQTALAHMAEHGSLVDAAIAGAAVLCSALPHACGLGGDCFILLHRAGKTYGLNGSGCSPMQLPSSVTSTQLASGALSCSTPGLLGAWEALHQRFGTQAWESLFQPAIDLASQGLDIADDLEKALSSLHARLDADPGCRALFLSEAARPRPGVLLQPALARSFESIAREGARAFYHGPMGRQLCLTVGAQGGVLSPEDLAAFEPIWEAPVQYRYRGLDVCTTAPNSYGVLMLLQLAALAPSTLGLHGFSSPERLRLLMQAAQQAIRLGTPLLADPQTIRQSHPVIPPPEMIEALQSLGLDQADNNSASTVELSRSHGTALIAIADHHGDGITIIQSIFTPFGSLVGDADTGIVLNNRLLGFSADPASSNHAQAGKRPAHTLSPSMVLKKGKLHLLLTTPGGSGQTITLTQVLTSLVDYDQSLTQAISNARWSLDLQGRLLAEEGIPPRVVEALNQAGLEVLQAGPEHRFFFGSAECIHIGEDMTLTAVADNRRNASAGGR